jgi:hemerythrin-like domain-containing protein
VPAASMHVSVACALLRRQFRTPIAMMSAWRLPVHNASDQGCGCNGGSQHPVDVLSAEHRTILAVLDRVASEVRRLEDDAAPDKAFWSPVLDFLENYADRCHHGKEEQVLFAEMERAGLPREGGPTACMRFEHAEGRDRRREMADALAAGNAGALAIAASGYLDLLFEHIHKEEQVLFPLAKSMLDGPGVERVRRGFASLEEHDMGKGTHARYESLAATLARGGQEAAAD